MRPLTVAALTVLCAVTPITACGASVTTSVASPATSAAPAATSAASQPTSAASGTTVMYGFAWADGTGTLRITPAKVTLDRRQGPPRYTFKPIPGAQEQRIDYSRADFRRITSECGLKETEGVVKLDAQGLGTTRCKPSDLAFALSLGPTPVKISLGTTESVREVLAAPGDSETAYGTIQRVNDTTVLFTKDKMSIKLGYTDLLFSRITGSCGAAWSADHANAGKNGLGDKICTGADFTTVLKSLQHPVSVKLDYIPLSGQLNEVWEVA